MTLPADHPARQPAPQSAPQSAGTIAARLRRRRALAALPLAALAALAAAALTGCVAAAALPLVAGGGMAHKMLRPHAPSPTPGDRPVPATPPVATDRPAPAASPGPTASQRAAATADPAAPVLARPSDVAQMRPGVLYAGALPPPSGASPAPADRAPTAADTAGAGSSEGRKLWSWADVVPFVADRMLTTPSHGALLERGSSAADPHWAPCGDRPRAILADLGTAAVAAPDGSWKVSGAARRWLGALQTLDVGVIFTGAAPPGAADAIRVAFDKAGLGRLVPVGGLRLGLSSAAMPGERAAAAATHCVLAAVGRAPADFPNGLLPGTTPPALAATWGTGWFRLPDAR